MKLLTFGLFIAAITVQISAVDIVQEREDGEGDLESRIDVETEEERVKALDVESRKYNLISCLIWFLVYLLVVNHWNDVFFQEN